MTTTAIFKCQTCNFSHYDKTNFESHICATHYRRDEALPTKDTRTFNYERRRRSLLEYMHVKIEDGDWHAVSDVANDLRVMESENNIRGIKYESSGSRDR